MTMPIGDEGQVFINCPFDGDYVPLFDAMVFAIYKCGFLPRCVKEIDDASQNRLDKIMGIIDECDLGIHDISRTELDSDTCLPRFNMPLELGLFLGAKKWGRPEHNQKKCLVLDRCVYRYQKFISDLAGQDIKSHKQSPQTLVTVVRDWLSSVRPNLMSGSLLWEDYSYFRSELSDLCSAMNLVEAELTFLDYRRVVYGWLERMENVAIRR